MPKDDADHLIPRRRHSGRENPTAEEARGAWAYFDSRRRLAGSAYDEPHWSLGDAIRWITDRTRAAVDGASIDEDAAPAAVCELQDALARGEVHASGSTAADPLPRPFPPETWASHQICIEDDGNLLWPYVEHIASEREVLLYVRLPRAEVLQRWAPLDVAEPIPTGTKGKETACKGWLTALMRAEPDRPRPKEEVWAEASHKFPGLAQRAFERAWRDAAKDQAPTPGVGPGGAAKSNHRINRSGYFGARLSAMSMTVTAPATFIDEGVDEQR